MMEVTVVLDTNIWVNALSEAGNAEYSMNCQYLISNFMQTKSVMLAVDSGNMILKEYGDNLNHVRMFQQYINQLYRENRFYFVNGKVPDSIKKKLLEVGFHESEDQTFVAVAYRSGKYIISDDSDYGTHGEQDKKEAHEYITEHLQIRLENSEEGLKSSREMMRMSM